MPMMFVTLTPNAFDAEEQARLAVALTEAACEAESVADTPQARARAIVLIEELKPGAFYSAASPAHDRVRMVMIRWLLSAGVLDAARKARFAVALQAAAQGAVLRDDGRPVATSCVIDEIPEGAWAQNGRIARLPDVTAIAGFGHLVEALTPA